MRKDFLKISISGVRGIVGEAFTPQLATKFAANFGEYCGRGRILVGRDTRQSGIMLEHAVIAGLLSVGCQAVSVGIISTPTLLLAVKEAHANGGIIISASHNPAEWNALKFINGDGLFLNHTESAELLNLYNQPDINFVTEEEFRKKKVLSGFFEIHTSKIFSNIDIDTIRKAKIKVALDCCNGAGALYTPGFLEKLGCQVYPVFTECNGIFPHNPEPAPKNLKVLSHIVKQKKCDIGFAQDPDCDRLAICDETGKILSSDYPVALATEHILSEHRPVEQSKLNVTVNIQTSQLLADIAEQNGAAINYSAVGEINVIEKMKQCNSIIGGEGSSGGVIWPAVHYARDSFSAMALILEMLALRKQKLSRIIKNFPCYYKCSEKIECSSVQAVKIIRKFYDQYRKFHPVTVDGIMFTIDGVNILLRISNTEQLLRIVTEAKNEQSARNTMKNIINEVSALLVKNQ